MAQFPLNQIEPGRSQNANPTPLAPNPLAGPQDMPFGGMRGPWESSAPGTMGSFAQGQAEMMGPQQMISHSMPQSRAQISGTPESESGMGEGTYLLPSAIQRTE